MMPFKMQGKQPWHGLILEMELSLITLILQDMCFQSGVCANPSPKVWNMWNLVVDKTLVQAGMCHQVCFLLLACQELG
eukprot:1428410-Amphidinium_carterae.1